jgi:hypothetical protein
MKVAIFNVFDENAYDLCSAVLDEGIEVVAFDDNNIGDLNEEEEGKWLQVGRNANFVYEEKVDSINKIKNQDSLKNIYYFLKEENRNNEMKFIEKLVGFCGANNLEIRIFSKDDTKLELEKVKNLEVFVTETRDKWVKALRKIIVELIDN